MEKCLFCRIIQGEFGDILCETQEHIVIADINPITRGHLLVIPKYHANQLDILPDAYLQGGLVLIKKIVLQLGLKKYNILQNNGHHQSVHHVHYHIIPYDEETQEGIDINFTVSARGKESLPGVIEEYKKKLQDLSEK
ncbi:hypothetical protein NEAUS04_1168 [Nematocida ausubeli]|nr:hypothetical protein NEAUS04_1168 [Nematocida ausubeli]